MYQNLWYEVKVVLRGKFIAWNANIGEEERSKINNLHFHLSELKKEEKIKYKVSKKKRNNEN